MLHSSCIQDPINPNFLVWTIVSTPLPVFPPPRLSITCLHPHPPKELDVMTVIKFILLMVRGMARNALTIQPFYFSLHLLSPASLLPSHLPRSRALLELLFLISHSTVKVRHPFLGVLSSRF